MQRIQLTKGAFAVIDDDAFVFISQRRWHLSPRGYAHCNIWNKDLKRYDSCLMHRLLMGATKGQCVDHRNHNKLDNRRSNLRTCTVSQNLQNRRLRITNTSGFKGVYPSGKKWQARITAKGQRYYLGLCTSPEDAAVMYNVAAQLFHGEFATLNRV